MNEQAIGELAFVTIWGAVCAFPLSLFLLWLYRRAVLRSMNARSLSPSTRIPTAPPSSHATHLHPPSLELVTIADTSLATKATTASYEQATRRPWQAAAVYAAAGLLFALVMVLAEFTANNFEFYPVRSLTLFWSAAWPVVLTVNLVAAATHRIQAVTTGAYFAIYFLLGAIGIAKSPNLTLGQVILFWSLENLPPTLLVLAFLSRRIRAVGTLVYTLMVVALTGAIVALRFFGANEAQLRTVLDITTMIGLGGTGTFFSIIVVGFSLFAVLGWLLAVWIRRGYESKKMTDQSILLDSIWLLFAIYHGIDLAFEGSAWFLSSLVAFLVYKVVVLSGFRLVHRYWNGAPSNTRLLLLRVFALGKRSERMFDAVTKHWRYIGSVQLIAGPDLATTPVKPHEFLGFLSGKLARLFINGKAELNQRIVEMDVSADFDGRFRINDFFCRDDTWEMVLSRLVRESDVILMDLRGFSLARQGCIRELNELINVVPVQRVVLMVDETTNLSFLERTIRQSWSAMLPTSPNATGPSRVIRLFQINSGYAPPALPPISELCASAVLSPDITPNETTAILVGISGSLRDHRFFVEEEIFRIGTAADNDLNIKDDVYVSGNHAYLRYKEGALSIVDQHSKNGTFVNDNRLRDAPLIVKAGDKIRLGKSIIEVVWVKREYEKVTEGKRA